MSEAGEAGKAGGAAGGGGGGGAGVGGAGGGGGGEGRVQHPRSFKLRFAAQREPGRSYVSLVKPRPLMATVTGKFYSSDAARESAGAEAELAALRRIQDMFQRGPRERLPAPLTESHVYGWYSAGVDSARGDRRRSHHIRDSAWLKGRILVLAADDKLKRK